MPLLTVDALHKSFGTRVLFSGISFSIEEGEKVGFVGANGTGKSTLFRILGKMEAADAGSIAIRRGASVGYLAQDPAFEPGHTIIRAVSGGRPEMMTALDEYYAIAAALERPSADTDRLLGRQGELMARIEALGGWGWQHEVETVLTRLGIDHWERPVAGLSGGERKRVALARILLERPDLLLLDEPTNHLDADTTQWLETALLEYPGAVLLITHDRYFLDRVVTRMLEIGEKEFVSHEGGYTEYLESRATRLRLEAAEADRRDRLMEQELAWVRRSPSARTGKQKARIKRLESMQAEAAAEAGPPAGLEMVFGAPPRLGRTVLEIENVSKSFDGRTLIRPFDARLRAGERIGIIGPNGAGKTTLLRIILGLEQPDTGLIKLGTNTRVTYFDQERKDLDPSISVYEALGPEEWVTVGGRRVHSRSYLESFLFPTRMHQLRVGSLSGGERNRLLLAKLLLTEGNLLILDEPTNDLDLPTLQVLESALADFQGCLLVVSHDRFFLDKVATGLLVFEPGGQIHRHEGGYDLYRRLREEREAREREKKEAAAVVRPKATKAAVSPVSAKPRRLSYKERQELDGMEEAIMAAEAERDRLTERLSDPSVYADNPQSVADLRREFEQAEARVAVLYARWAELEEIEQGKG